MYNNVELLAVDIRLIEDEENFIQLYKANTFSALGVITNGLGGTRRMDNESVSSTSTQTEAFVRNPKIMHGTPTVEGQYPWQVSLELLHPSYGFIGHWCGGVLIDRNWVLSAAHCIHNDLFNLPLPALWTVVLGEYDRRTESGYEQRIPVDKIILHEKYHNFKHDLVLLKLTRPANTSPSSRTAKKDTNSVNHYQHRRVNLNSKFGNNRRRNDKFSHAPVYYRNEPNYRNEDLHDYSMKDDATAAPAREVETEAESISAAMPDTSQYGDSGGPLQCRISKRGPWILVGITSFGSGCAFKNYPDVYTKISFYRQWIADTIEKN
ncbi:hypothetical protein AND_002009 [Anopheles darlingi]|uniref:Peptidase S1 domain-containing protein n=1 Tax=Anopheles darlingi TaxID=43151 RepID=W5JTC6_ANODA|nr:hypothetical protein AND_002009 [Anopheles darlingi]